MLETVIIGAGPAGLVAAKECLEAGLAPIIFEKNAGLGGTWNDVSGKVWQSMRSNLSHFHIGFSDFMWPEEQKDYPVNQEIFKYLQDYSKHYSLDKKINFKAAITNISFEERSKTWILDLNNREKVVCANLIISNGFLGKAYWPPIFANSVFKGPVIHSEQYKAAGDFSGKKVLVIGSGASGYEIASDLARQGIEVRHLFLQAAWVLSRYGPEANHLLPADLSGYCYPEPGRQTDVYSRNRDQINQYKKAYGNPGDVNDYLRVEENPCKAAHTVICDDYLALAGKEGIIMPYKGVLAEVLPKGVRLESGIKIAADAIVLCTGHNYALPTQDRSIKKKLGYREAAPNSPMILYNQTIHPSYKNVSFIGAFKGTFWGIMELQARWVASLLTNSVSYPAMQKQKMIDKTGLTVSARDTMPPPACDYVDTMCRLSGKLNAYPAALAEAARGQRIPLLPADFRSVGIGAKPTVASQQRQRLEKRMKQLSPAATTL